MAVQEKGLHLEAVTKLGFWALENERCFDFRSTVSIFSD